MTDDERRHPYVDLRTHFEALWTEREKRLQERWIAQEAALSKATHTMELRLDHLNQLREGVVTREEYDSKHEALIVQVAQIRVLIEDRLSKLENWKSNIMGRAVAFGVIGAIFVAGMAAIFTHLAVK